MRQRQRDLERESRLFPRPTASPPRVFNNLHAFSIFRILCVINCLFRINMLPRLTRKSVEYIESRKDSKKPFFLYVPLGSPHTPIVPTPEWEGKSGLGSYGDFVMQTENVVGEMTGPTPFCTRI